VGDRLFISPTFQRSTLRCPPSALPGRGGVKDATFPAFPPFRIQKTCFIVATPGSDTVWPLGRRKREAGRVGRTSHSHFLARVSRAPPVKASAIRPSPGRFPCRETSSGVLPLPNPAGRPPVLAPERAGDRNRPAGRETGLPRENPAPPGLGPGQKGLFTVALPKPGCSPVPARAMGGIFREGGGGVERMGGN
jgi:hypothetical protein